MTNQYTDLEVLYLEEVLKWASACSNPTEIETLRALARNEIKQLLEIHLPITAGKAPEIIANALPDDVLAPLVVELESLWRME